MIWDNLHANDYDQRRLFLGPYVGRSVELIPKLNGVLTNPNCEYGANYVPIHTLAIWSQCGRSISHKSPPIKQSILLEVGKGEVAGSVCLYEPQKALDVSLKQWYTEFQHPRKKLEQYRPVKSAESVSKANDFEQGGGSSKMELDLPKQESTYSKMDTSLPPVVDDSMHVSSSLPPYEAPPTPSDPFTLDDIRLLVDYFYLPHKHGSKAVRILEEFCWLKEKAPGYELLKAHGYLRGHEVKEPDDCIEEEEEDDVAKAMVAGGMGEGMSCGMRSDGETSESIVEDEEMSDGEVREFYTLFQIPKFSLSEGLLYRACALLYCRASYGREGGREGRGEPLAATAWGGEGTT